MSDSSTSQWAGLRGAGETIAGNAEYVLQELEGLEAPDTWPERVRAVWGEVLDAGQRIGAMAARGESNRVRHPLDEVEVIENRLASTLHGLDQLVRDLGATGEPDARLAVLSILVTESAAHVVRACAELRTQAKVVRAEAATPDRGAPSLREEAGLPEGADLVRALPCDACGRTAATLEAGIDPLTGTRALVYSGLVRREAFGLESAAAIFARLADGRVGEVHRLLGPEGLDAYCPACGLVYCRNHYRIEAEYDEGFYDCTRATCPAGHRRMVDD